MKRYFDKVIKNNSGIAKEFYFFLTPKYWKSFLNYKKEKLIPQSHSSSLSSSSDDLFSDVSSPLIELVFF